VNASKDVKRWLRLNNCWPCPLGAESAWRQKNPPGWTLLGEEPKSDIASKYGFEESRRARNQRKNVLVYLRCARSPCVINVNSSLDDLWSLSDAAVRFRWRSNASIKSTIKLSGTQNELTIHCKMQMKILLNLSRERSPANLLCNNIAMRQATDQNSRPSYTCNTLS